MDSKETIILIVGLLGSIFATIIVNNVKLDITLWLILSIMLALILIIIFYLPSKISEMELKLESQEFEQTRLNEKIKIYKELTEIKSEIKLLKEKIKEDGKKIK